MRSGSFLISILFLSAAICAGEEQAGVPDPSFGDGGTALTAAGTVQSDIHRVIAARDGKIVAFGEATDGTKKSFAIARYTRDGKLDQTFNGTGIVTTSIGTFQDYAFDGVVLPDRKIIAAGWTRSGLQSEFAVTRYEPDGKLDRSFGNGGIVTLSQPNGWGGVYAMTRLPDGKLLLLGQTVFNGINYYVTLMRLEADGALDASFGNNGIVNTPVNGVFPHAILIQADHKIVVGGHFLDGSEYHITLLRYLPDGTLDTTFGTGGQVVTAQLGASVCWTLLPQRGGKIVAAGAGTVAGHAVFALARYQSDGSLDPDFGSGGTVTTSIGGVSDYGNGAVKTGSHIVLAGYSGTGSGRQFALARYDEEGELDSDFGNNGTTTLSVGTGGSAAESIAADRFGRLVTGGSAKEGPIDEFGLARFLP